MQAAKLRGFKIDQAGQAQWRPRVTALQPHVAGAEAQIYGSRRCWKVWRAVEGGRSIRYVQEGARVTVRVRTSPFMYADPEPLGWQDGGDDLALPLDAVAFFGVVGRPLRQDKINAGCDVVGGKEGAAGWQH